MLTLALLINGIANRYTWHVTPDGSVGSGLSLLRIDNLTGKVTSLPYRLPAGGGAVTVKARR